jgi:hypothetical protein
MRCSPQRQTHSEMKQIIQNYKSGTIRNIATPFPSTELRAWAIENGYLVNSAYEALDSTTYVKVTPIPPLALSSTIVTRLSGRFITAQGMCVENQKKS